MKINIYYGGRGIVGDPTLFVISRMEQVLTELNVDVVRYNLGEEKHNITALPSTLNDADGIILATTVEWCGLGGYMTEFLDACFFYGNKGKISGLYMYPVVMSTTYGERKALCDLQIMWDTLGGLSCSGLAAYVMDPVAFELNKEYTASIESAAENLYRTISRKALVFPVSSPVVKQISGTKESIPLTQEETEQLSKYASDDKYLQKQKEDLKDLADHFKNLLANGGMPETEVLLNRFKDVFSPKSGMKAVYVIEIEGYEEPLFLDIEGSAIKAGYGGRDDATVRCHSDKKTMDAITGGETNFQHAFMAGDMKVKGDLKLLREMDAVFPFSKQG